jgi:hypothetical protein
VICARSGGLCTSECPRIWTVSGEMLGANSPSELAELLLMKGRQSHG